MNTKQFNEIIDGWKNLLFKDDSVEQIAKSRIAICCNCEHLTNRNTCDLCGCYMPAKTRNISSSCSMNPKKW